MKNSKNYYIAGTILCLIDSGVYGCEEQIIEYLKGIGRDFTDVKGIFLTHAHPDHIGSATWFQENHAKWIESLRMVM